MTKNRREILLGIAAIAVLGIGVAGYEGWAHLARGYPPTPYDDLLSLLPGRDDAKLVGRAFLARNPDFKPHHAATALRRHIGQRALADVLQAEIARGRLIEADRWLIPETLAGLCALAAKT